MALTIKGYNAAERAAMDRLPNRITESCRPELFIKAGYPIEAADESGLYRYVDVMHENRDAADYQNLLGGFTAEEFELFKEISGQVGDFSQQRFGRRMLPKGALTRAMLSLRHIRMLIPPGAAVFEVGPGSGYLGVLLATAGFRYGACDIAQGFYLYQSHLWQHLFGERLVELADDNREFTGYGEIPPGGLLHVPWWKYTTPQAEQIDTPIDMYVANHALNEMNLYSLCYTFRLSHQLLSKSPRHGYFFIENAGGQALRTCATTFHYFFEAKFARAFEDGGVIDVFAPAQRMQMLVASPAAAHALSRLRSRLGHLSNEIKRHGGVVRTAAKVLRCLGSAKARERMQQAAKHMSESASVPAPAETVVHRQIIEGRASLEKQSRVPFEAVRAFQRAQMPGGDVRSEDERFFQYVFGKDFYS